MADTATADIEVDVPGTGVVSFPGDMSHEDIEATIRRGFKPAAQPQADFLVKNRPYQGGVSTIAGGPVPALPPPQMPDSEDIHEFVEAGSKPAVKLPRFTVNPDDSKGAAILKSVANLGISLPEFVESPFGATAAATGAAVPRIAAAAFLGSTAKGVNDQAKQLGEQWDILTPAQKAAGLTDIAGNTVLAGAMAHGTGIADLAKPRVELPPEISPEAAKALPKTAAEVAKIQPQQPSTTEVPNASSKQETAAVHGDVQSQPVQGEGQVPVAQGGGGVQPRPNEAQATGPRPAAHAEAPVPAIKVGGKVYEAQSGEDNHLAIISRLKGGEKPDLTGMEEGFVNAKGEFEGRTKAAETTGLPTAKEPGKLHSSDLINTPDSIMAMPDADLLKLTSETDERGVRKFRVQEQGIKWGAQQPAEALQAIEAKAKDVQKDMLAAMQDPKRTAEVSALQQRAQYLASAAEGIRGANGLGGVTATYDDLVKKGMIKQPEAVGMGGAKLGEVAVQGNPDIHGVNNAVREEMAKAGRAQPPVSGEGISPADSVQHGLDLLDGGTDPEQAMQNFEKTKRLNADDIAVVRARGAQLAYIQARIEEKFGTDSDEYRRAMKASDDWQTRYEPMRTDWHKQGQAQQGETDIDTGTFTGLRRAFKDANPDKEFTPQQAKKAKSMSSVVKQAVIKAEAAKHSLFDLLGKKFNPVEDAEKAALQAVHTHHQEAAARMAEADRKLQVAEEVRRQAIARTFTDAEQAALKSANQTVRDAAVRKAKAERDAAVKEADRQLKFAKAQAAEAKAKEMAAAKKVRDAASKMAEAERRALADPMATVWKRVKEYIDKGVDDYDDVRNKVATELGMKVDQVTRLMAQDPRVKRLADDVWRKQGQARAMKEQAKRWVASLSIPKYEKVLRSVPGALFSAKVGFGLHGFVALGTHAPFVGFMPRYLPMYLKNFGRMYNMVFSPAFYEQKVQDLYRDPNFATAKRAGLQNDPIKYEEYANIDFTSALGQKITGMSPKVGQIYSSAMAAGNRGYAILKFLRQDMFNQHWAKMPDTLKTPEMAAAISADVNHLTGVTEAKAPKGLNLLLFAPRLEGSRIMFGAGDPVRALRAFGDWKNATPDQKYFAINQVKEKATIAAVMFSLLEANKAMLKLTGSKQQVNTDDPMRSDFMKFKIAGMDLSYGNPMITMARLPIRLNALRYKGGSGKMAKLIYPDESMTAQLEQYVRSQMSPAAGDAADFIFKGDYENKPLPKMPLSGPQLPMPKRLAARGEKPYTWSELGIEAVLPIPAEEAVRDVWKNGFGMSEAQIDGYLKAIAKASFMMGTGARLTDDTQVPGK